MKRFHKGGGQLVFICTVKDISVSKLNVWQDFEYSQRERQQLQRSPCPPPGRIFKRFKYWNIEDILRAPTWQETLRYSKKSDSYIAIRQYGVELMPSKVIYRGLFSKLAAGLPFAIFLITHSWMSMVQRRLFWWSTHNIVLCTAGFIRILTAHSSIYVELMT